MKSLAFNANKLRNLILSPIFLLILFSALVTCAFLPVEAVFARLQSVQRITIKLLYNPCLTLFLFLLSSVSLYICSRFKRKLLPNSRSCLCLFCSCAVLSLIFQHDFPALFLLPFSMLFLLGGVCFSVVLMGRFSTVIFTLFLFLSCIMMVVDCMGIVLDSSNLAQIFATTKTDALRFLTTANIASLILAFFASWATGYYLIYRVVRKESRLTLFNTGCISLAAFFLFFQILEQHIRITPKTFWPLGVMENLGQDCKNAINEIARVKSVVNAIPSYESIQADIPDEMKNQGVICILHVGESVRADHMAFNGYQRNTTPWLNNCPGMINFPECISSAKSTDVAVLTMLTNARRAIGYEEDETSRATSGGVMDYFAHSGFECASFWMQNAISTSGLSLFAAEASRFARCCKKVEEVAGMPMLQQEAASRWLEEKKNSKDNVFVLLNNNGSHVYYTSYDEENPPFTPVTPPSANDAPADNPAVAANMITAYDCTIHYTDEFIRRLLTQLKGRPFLYVYMSDHGDYLGDDGYWTRGSIESADVYHATSGCLVPFFVIASPEFEALNPRYKEALEQLRSHQGMRTAHEHLFHTLLGIFCIKTKDYDSSLDLSSQEVKSYNGACPERNERR